MDDRPRPRTLTEALFEVLPVPSLVHDDTTVLAANAGARRLLDATRMDEVVGRAVSEFVHEHGRAAGEHRRALLIDVGQSLSGVTVKLISCRGKSVVVTGCATTCDIGTTTVAILAASASPQITAGNRSPRMSFPEGTDLCDAVLDAFPLACVAVCGETIAYANRAAAVATRATGAADLIGRHVADLVAPEAHASILEQLKLTLAHGVRLSGIAAKSRALDGAAFMVRGEGARLRHNGCDYAVFVATSIGR